MNTVTGNASSSHTVKIAAISDLHYKLDSTRPLRAVFERVAKEADILLVCGDITHHGLAGEAAVFIEDAAPVLGKIPVLGVLGNHDFESGNQEKISRRLGDAGLIMLDGDTRHIRGIGFAGVKGFAGGFGRMALQPWGEAVIKNFVREAAAESQKLARALSALDSGPKIVLMHYSPIRETVAGEPQEIVPFLGSSSLEEPLNRFAATAVFHGHAHKGCLQGKTGANVPVYNVSIGVLKKHFPDRPPFFLLEVCTDAPAGWNRRA